MNGPNNVVGVGHLRRVSPPTVMPYGGGCLLFFCCFAGLPAFDFLL